MCWYKMVMFYILHYRSMDKYARLMQKLEIMNVEFFKVISFFIPILYI